MSYETAEQARQQVLDHLNANGPMSAGQIFTGLNALTKNSVETSLATMRRHNEVKRMFAGQATKYEAIAKRTVSAETMRQQVATAQAMKGFQPKPPKSQQPGHYRHTPGHYDVPGHIQGQPLSNQEGQGSGRRRVYVGAPE